MAARKAKQSSHSTVGTLSQPKHGSPHGPSDNCDGDWVPTLQEMRGMLKGVDAALLRTLGTLGTLQLPIKIVRVWNDVSVSREARRAPHPM